MRPEYAGGEENDLTHDVIVRIPLHPYPERTVDPDGRATELAELTRNAINSTLTPNETPYTVSAGIYFVEMGYGEAV